jgi:hypothetical protein
MNINQLTRIYTYLLRCFPIMYRKEYEEELVYTFRMAARDSAEGRGTGELIVFAWRELRDMPWAALQAHLYERRRTMKHLPGAHLPGEPVVRWRLAAVLLPFLFPLVFTLLSENLNSKFGNIPDTIIIILLFIMLLLILGTAVFGGFKGLPTWSLPALGIPLFIAGFFLMPLGFNIPWPADLPSRVAVQIIRGMIVPASFGLMAVILMLLFTSFSKRIQQDWSILTFLLYGTLTLHLLLNDPYRGLAPYEAGGFLIMGAGAYLFLIMPKRWHRLWVLLLAVLLAFALQAVGVYTIYPDQTFAGNQDARMWETMLPLLMVPGMLLLLAISPLLALFSNLKMK